MKASRLVALACASLAAFAAPTSEIVLDFEEGCVTKGYHAFTDAVKVREYIASLPKLAGNCESVKVSVRYTLDEVTRCASSGGSVVEGVAIGSLLHRDLLNLNHYGDVYLDKATFHYDGEVSGDCHAATIKGTADMRKECTALEQAPFAMRSGSWENYVFFLPRYPRVAVKVADFALQADFGKRCVVPGKARRAELHLAFTLGLQTPVGVKDASIVFPDQPDCKPRGCESIVGTRGFETCLDNARGKGRCRKAVYTRTYLHVGSSQCDPTVPGKFHLNMDTILADDKALNLKDKRTVVTSVKFGQKFVDDACSDTILGLTRSCSDAPSLKSTLREDLASHFAFTGEEAITDNAVATNYTVTTACNTTASPQEDEVTVKTEFAIPYNFAAAESFARIPLAGLLIAAAIVLCIGSL